MYNTTCTLWTITSLVFLSFLKSHIWSHLKSHLKTCHLSPLTFNLLKINLFLTNICVFGKDVNCLSPAALTGTSCLVFTFCNHKKMMAATLSFSTHNLRYLYWNCSLGRWLNYCSGASWSLPRSITPSVLCTVVQSCGPCLLHLRFEYGKVLLPNFNVDIYWTFWTSQ